MPIISGGFGLFRRDMLIAVGGYDSDTLGEDFDVTLKLHRFACDRGLPYRIVQLPSALCWTVVPESRRVLRRQRVRWHHGLLQVLWKHRGMFFRPRYGRFSFAALPWATFYELLNPPIVVLATLATLLGLAVGLMTWHALLIGAFITWSFVVAATLAALLMTESPAGSSIGWRNLGVIVAFACADFGYQALTMLFRLEAMFRPSRGWGEMEKSVRAPPRE